MRVRSGNLSQKMKHTLAIMHLHKSNWLVFFKDTPTNRGMLQKVKDYVTWGEVPKSFVEKVLKERGEKGDGFTFDEKSYKPYVRLAPPRKGFRSVKKNVGKGGALGYRKEKISALIERMI